MEIRVEKNNETISRTFRVKGRPGFEHLSLHMVKILGPYYVKRNEMTL